MQSPAVAQLEVRSGSELWFCLAFFCFLCRALCSNRGWREKNFENVFFEPVWRGNLFQMKVFGAAIDSVKFSSKSELSSRLFGRLKLFDFRPKNPKNEKCNFSQYYGKTLRVHPDFDEIRPLPKHFFMILIKVAFFVFQVFCRVLGNLGGNGCHQ